MECSDILIKYFQYLDYKNINNIKLTCKLWNNIANNNLIWFTIVREIFYDFIKKTNKNYSCYVFYMVDGKNEKNPYFDFGEQYMNSIKHNMKYKSNFSYLYLHQSLIDNNNSFFKRKINTMWRCYPYEFDMNLLSFILNVDKNEYIVDDNTLCWSYYIDNDNVTYVTSINKTIKKEMMVNDDIIFSFSYENDYYTTFIQEFSIDEKGFVDNTVNYPNLIKYREKYCNIDIKVFLILLIELLILNSNTELNEILHHIYGYSYIDFNQ